jgi:RecB family exonuclease
MTKQKLPIYSPTKISAFVECPLKYKFLYVEKIGRFYYKPNPWNSFGGTLHRVLETLHRPGAESLTVDELLVSYNEMWNGVGYSSEEEEARFRAEGERILRLYHANPASSDAKVVLTEKQVKWEMGDFVIAGRLDRLDEHPDGALEIIDYKSHLVSTTEEDVRNSIAMSMYQVIVAHLYPGRRVFASIHCLAGGIKISAELSTRERDEVEARTRTTASTIATAEEYPPKQSERCPKCDFHRLCAKQPWFGNEEHS